AEQRRWRGRPRIELETDRAERAAGDQEICDGCRERRAAPSAPSALGEARQRTKIRRFHDGGLPAGAARRGAAVSVQTYLSLGNRGTVKTVRSRLAVRTAGSSAAPLRAISTTGRSSSMTRAVRAARPCRLR